MLRLIKLLPERVSEQVRLSDTAIAILHINTSDYTAWLEQIADVEAIEGSLLKKAGEIAQQWGFELWAAKIDIQREQRKE